MSEEEEMYELVKDVRRDNTDFYQMRDIMRSTAINNITQIICDSIRDLQKDSGYFGERMICKIYIDIHHIQTYM